MTGIVETAVEGIAVVTLVELVVMVGMLGVMIEVVADELTVEEGAAVVEATAVPAAVEVDEEVVGVTA